MLCNETCATILELFDKLRKQTDFLVTSGWLDSTELTQILGELLKYSNYTDVVSELNDLLTGDAEDLGLPGITGTQLEEDEQADPSELFEPTKNIAKVLRCVYALNIDQFDVSRPVGSDEREAQQ